MGGREGRGMWEGGREGRRRGELVASTCSVSNFVPMPLCSQLPITHSTCQNGVSTMQPSVAAFPADFG